MRLTTKNNDVDNWADLKEGEYIIIVANSTGAPCNLVFKCLGCGEPLGIGTLGGQGAVWEIDFEKLHASPSILHDEKKGGCGWHGYLTNGNLQLDR
jgi:hypothetical protein